MITQDKILKDGKLHIFLLGSGGPINNNLRVASSIAVIAGVSLYSLMWVQGHIEMLIS